MNESLETELKSLSISELNDLYDYLKSKKKSIFRTMKYDKTLFIESNIESISNLKRWINSLTRKSKEKLKDDINEFMLILNYVEALKSKRIDEFVISEDTDLLNELNNKYPGDYGKIPNINKKSHCFKSSYNTTDRRRRRFFRDNHTGKVTYEISIQV